MDPLARLNDRIINCERCPRLRDYCRKIAAQKKRAYQSEDYWGRPVPGFGDPAARVLIVGLAPAAHGGNRTGRVFTGDSSGDFLFSALYRAGFANQPTSVRRGDGLRLKGAYIAATARCAPPDNKPLPSEIDSCLPYLAEEMEILPAVSVIVALGRIAFGAALRLLRERGLSPATPPAFSHGAVCQFTAAEGHRSEHGFSRAQEVTLISSYHPSRQNTNTGRLTVSMFDEVFSAAAGVVNRGR